jgi:hypothetical protein
MDLILGNKKKPGEFKNREKLRGGYLILKNCFIQSAV